MRRCSTEVLSKTCLILHPMHHVKYIYIKPRRIEIRVLSLYMFRRIIAHQVEKQHKVQRKMIIFLLKNNDYNQDEEYEEKKVGFVENADADSKVSKLKRRDTPHHLKNKRVTSTPDKEKMALLDAVISEMFLTGHYHLIFIF